MRSVASIDPQSRFQLSFRPRSAVGSCLNFPCDELGCVDMDSLGERKLASYLYARAVVGAEFVAPIVEITCGTSL
jgi:hypothetical protein